MHPARKGDEGKKPKELKIPPDVGIYLTGRTISVVSSLPLDRQLNLLINALLMVNAQIARLQTLEKIKSDTGLVTASGKPIFDPNKYKEN